MNNMQQRQCCNVRESLKRRKSGGERYVSAKKTKTAELLEIRALSCCGGISGRCYVHFVLFAEGNAVCNRGSANRSGYISFEVLRGASYEGCCGEKSEDVCGSAEADVRYQGQTVTKTGRFSTSRFVISHKFSEYPRQFRAVFVLCPLRASGYACEPAPR